MVRPVDTVISSVKLDGILKWWMDISGPAWCLLINCIIFSYALYRVMGFSIETFGNLFLMV